MWYVLTIFRHCMVWKTIENDKMFLWYTLLESVWSKFPILIFPCSYIVNEKSIGFHIVFGAPKSGEISALMFFETQKKSVPMCIGKILIEITVLGHPEAKKVVFKVSSVCVYECMHKAGNDTNGYIFYDIVLGTNPQNLLALSYFWFFG